MRITEPMTSSSLFGVAVQTCIFLTINSKIIKNKSLDTVSDI